MQILFLSDGAGSRRSNCRPTTSDTCEFLTGLYERIARSAQGSDGSDRIRAMMDVAQAV